VEAAEFLGEAWRARAQRFRVCLARATSDPSSDDAIHDLRVAIRRVFAWIAVRDALLSPDPRLGAARSSLKALMSPLGKLRDAHVKRDWIRKVVPEGDEPSYLFAVQAGSDVLRWEERVRKLLGASATARLRVPAAGIRARPAAREEIGAIALRHIRSLELNVAKRREAALDPAHPEALHRMRLDFKKFRYAAEVFYPLFPRAGKPAAKRHQAFQTLLGTIHDCDVILAEARAFRRDVLGVAADCVLETAFWRLREERFQELVRTVGTPGGLSRVFGTEFRA
jgi:adenylate cyclase